MRDKPTTYAPMLPRGESFSSSCAARAAILRGERRRNFPDSPASFFRFTFEYREESSPTSVRNAFGKMMILDHAFDIQFFSRDVVKLSDEFETRFVRQVQPLTLNFQVLFGQQARGLTAVVAAALLPTHVSLRGLQPFFSLAQMLRVRNLLACRERGEVLNANVHADTRARLWDVAALVTFNAKADIPAVNLALECDRLNRAFNGAREAQVTTTDFRERQLVAREFPAALRKGERIITILVSEARIAGFLSGFDSAEETVKGFLHALQCVLQDLTVNRCDIGTLLLDFRQLVGLVVVVERDARHLVSVSPLLQRSVVEFAADGKRGGQLLVNRPRDPQLILERLSHFLRCVLLLDVALNGGGGDVSRRASFVSPLSFTVLSGASNR